MRRPVFLLGILAITAQTAFLREILATFRGGELIIGTALLFWLLWTAVGSGLVGRFAARSKSPDKFFFMLLPWYGIMGFLGVSAIAGIPFITRLTPGELVPFDTQFVAVGLAMLPFNVLGGVLFSLGVKALEKENLRCAGEAFTYESFGAALAGIVISILLVTSMSNETLALLCPVCALTVAALKQKSDKSFRNIPALFIPVIAILLVLWGNSLAKNHMYSGQELLSRKDTKYGRLRVTRRGEMITFYSDAAVLFSTPDPETSEFAVHIPMLAAPLHNRVLVLGGGPGGLLDEVLKYPTVETVTCVELDPNLFELTGRFLDERWKRDPRVSTIFTDGRAFLEHTDELFDVIIMTMPPPMSGLTNRYYTEEFFRLASSRLSTKGLLGFSLTGAENFLEEDRAHFLASIRSSLRSSFPSVKVLPGLTCRYLACNSGGVVDSLTWEDLTERRLELNIETTYVRDYFLRYTLSPERMTYIAGELDKVETTFVNTDMQPIGFFVRTLLQGNLDGSKILKQVQPLAEKRILLFLMAAVVLALSGLAVLPGKAALNRTITAAIIAVGLTEISLEILAIMAYQSTFGFLYGKIALLTGSYMAGLAVGARAGTRKVVRNTAGTKHLIIVQISIAALPILWIALLRLKGDFAGYPLLYEAGFYFLTALAGFAGGIQFPVADALYRRSAGAGVSNEGLMYGLDLAGSSIGALLTASLLIPVLGMDTVLIFLAILNLATAGALWLRS